MKNRTLKTGILCVAIVGCACSAFAQPDTTQLNDQGAAPAQADSKPAPAASTNTAPGSELFAAARDAVQNAKSISYRVKYYGTGGMTGYTGTIQADVRMLRDVRPGGPNNGWLMRVTGSGKQRANAEALEFDVSWLSGSGVEWVDHAAQKVIEKRNVREARTPAFQIAVSPRLKELFEARPFSRELDAATTYTIEGQAEHDGVLCDIVLVQAQSRSRARWAFARTDGLPRRYESIVENSMMSGSTVLELTSVVVETGDAARTTPAILRVDIPEGYEEDRPVRPAPVVAPTHDSETKLQAPGKDDPSPPDESGMDTKAQPVDMFPTAEDPPSPTRAAPAPPQTAAETSRAGEPFVLNAADGSEVSLESLRGNVVLLEFSGSWCLPCRESHKEIDALVEQMRGKPFIAYVVSCRDRSTEAAIDKFREKNRAFGLLLRGDAVAETWGVRNYPTYFLIGKQGEVLAVKRDFEKQATMSLLKEIAESHLSSQAALSATGRTSKP
jgi:thiol-disulfide isomerase/thioredoxin